MSDLMKATGVLGAMAVIGVGTYAATTYPVPSESLDTAIHASVQLEDYCSGTVIEDPDPSDGIQFTVLTAKHCMGEEDVIGKVLHVHVPNVIGQIYEQGSSVPVIIKDISTDSDLVLLQGMNPKTDPEITPMHVYGGIPQIGQASYAIGYPRAESLTVSYGLLGYVIENGGLGDLSKSNLWQKSTNAVQGGSSGGGLFIETASGYELVGCLTWGYRGDEGAAYWTPVDEIRAFLYKNSPEGKADATT
jgi:hypothetical protein